MDIDLVSPDTFLFGPPHDAFARLRLEAPVFLHRREDLPPFWVVTRHPDVVRVSRDGETFSSVPNGALLNEIPYGPRNEPSPTMLNLDPPSHTRLRRLAAPILALSERRVRALCTRTLDRAFELDDCDFAKDVAAEFCMSVLAELLGFPDQKDRRHVQWIARELSDPLESPMNATMELFRFARDIRGETGLTTREFELLVLVLITAGHLATQHLLAGAMLALIEHPRQWRLLRDNPAIMATGADEMLRWVSPLMQFQRTATKDTDIAGQPISKGDRVAMYYIAANRDEAVFDEPMSFDLTRSPNPHVAFGAGGPHSCLSDHLARLQIRVLFDELSRRTRQVELADTPDYLGSTFLNGISAMPVRFRH
ncbi:cholest-4-en-3-one 26-monooxygenase [Kibdelosporangium banguiense]|uniref:Cholest-4-en-3-one 26-monooxygenase n=1 Tax=Kibdelosporangium banguiense TaxID=1365924 RepID=A0ABS4TS87_9PSEU|nr:cytochrome P450 [Kibdelosporangium banguiense]MBP2326810.1 cholest-4-en-3-one 26-monooxygenase [Kibdelosporangium banguiense]